MNPAVEVQDVRKSFGEIRAIDGLSLDVPEGSIFGLLGPNGAGKSTTIRMILDIYRPDEARIRVLGRSAGPEVRAQVGYLPEERGRELLADLPSAIRLVGGADPGTLHAAPALLRVALSSLAAPLRGDDGTKQVDLEVRSGGGEIHLRLAAAGAAAGGTDESDPRLLLARKIVQQLDGSLGQETADGRPWTVLAFRRY